MTRILLAFVVGIGVVGISVSQGDKGKPKVTTISERDIVEKLDGKVAKATIVEVTLEPGQEGAPHRHAGPVFGYILEGEVRARHQRRAREGPEGR